MAALLVRFRFKAAQPGRCAAGPRASERALAFDKTLHVAFGAPNPELDPNSKLHNPNSTLQPPFSKVHVVIVHTLKVQQAQQQRYAQGSNGGDSGGVGGGGGGSSLDAGGDGELMRTEPAPPEASSPILEGGQAGGEEEEVALARQGQGGRQTYNVL